MQIVGMIVGERVNEKRVISHRGNFTYISENRVFSLFSFSDHQIILAMKSNL